MRDGTKIDELPQAAADGLEDGRVPAKEARTWKIEGQKRRITRRKYRRLWNEFETGNESEKKREDERENEERDETRCKKTLFFKKCLRTLKSAS